MLPAETFLHLAGPQIDRVARVVRLEDVVVAVAIEIHEAQAVVAAFVVHDRAAFGQRVARGLPLLLLFAPRKNVVVREQFAYAVVVEVAKAPAIVRRSFWCSRCGRKAGLNRFVALPSFTVPRPDMMRIEIERRCGACSADHAKVCHTIPLKL